MTTKYRTFEGVGVPLESIASEWRALIAGNTRCSSPYFSIEYFEAIREARKDVRISLVEEGERIIAILPHQVNRFGLARPVGGPINDFQGLISEDAGIELSSELLRRCGISVFNFDHLLLSREQELPADFFSASSPFIDISEGYLKYCDSRKLAGSEYIPKTLALARKLEREQGAVDFQFHDKDLDCRSFLMKWKSEQYRASGLVDLFSFPWITTAIDSLTRRQSSNFKAGYSSLRVGGELAAVHFGMSANGVLHYWWPTYNPKFSKYSVGIILLLKILEVCEENKIQRVDLGKGDASYKSRLMNGADSVAEGQMVSDNGVLCNYYKLRKYVDRIARRKTVAASILHHPLRVIKRLEWEYRFR